MMIIQSNFRKHLANRKNWFYSRIVERNKTELKMGRKTANKGVAHQCITALYKLFHPTIPDGRTWSKFGEHGQDGEHDPGTAQNGKTSTEM